jgi:hypothetical protein
VPTASGGRSDTPLRAFLEAFAHCAVAEANISELAAEIVVQPLGYDFNRERSALMAMAPESYWQNHLGHPIASRITTTGELTPR